VARKAAASSSKARRLSPEEKAQILRLHADGQSKKAIAEGLQTTPATVVRIIAESQHGSSPTTRTRRAATIAAPHCADLTKRLKALAVAIVMDGPIDECEKSALREIIEQRIADAQNRAAQEALASL
jgi:transposase-like protein